MNNVVHVALWGQPAAVIAWNPAQEIGLMEFYESFPKNGWDLAPLEMPLEEMMRGVRIFSFPDLKSKTFKGLPGLLADTLPDDYGNSIIDEWFAAKGKTVEITPLDRLCYMGKRGMGALEFEPANADELLNQSSPLEIMELVQLAQEILDRRTVFTADLRKNKEALIDILRVGTSAGGAKPKAIIALNDGTGEVRSGQVQAPADFGYWLLKFDGVEGGKIKDNPRGIGRIEFTYYRMALDCGIDMMESRLMEDKGQAHFMTRRFDRTAEGDKIMAQTLCAMAHYDRDHRHSYEQMFAVMRKLHLGYPEMEQMYRRMVFNIMMRNHDDHTKNHSFLMDRNGSWRLAPAYDLCYSYSPSGQWTNKHQMSVAGKREDFVLDDLLKTGEDQGVNAPHKIVGQITEVVRGWADYAAQNGVKTEFIRHINDNLRIKWE